MAIPISMLWRVQMSFSKKAALVGIFSLAVITCVFAIVRVTVISTLTRQPDTSWSYMWSSVEQCIGMRLLLPFQIRQLYETDDLTLPTAIIVASLGSFRTLFTQQASQLKQPKRSVLSDSKNIFLHGTRRLRPSKGTSIGLTGLSALGSTDQFASRDNTDIDQHEVVKMKDDVESWAGQSCFQQPPPSDGMPAETKYTRRGHQEGI